MEIYTNSSPKVILVEDEGLVRHLMRMALKQEIPDCEIYEASTVSEALEQARKKGPDLIIFDVGLSDGSGMDIPRILKPELDDIKYIVVTGQKEIIPVREALDLELSGFVRKGEPYEVWTHAIREVIQGRAYYSSGALQCLMEKADSGSSVLSKLTPRERDILMAAGRGLSVKEMADELKLSENTIKVHRHHVLQKLGLTDAVGMVRFAIAHGLATPQ